MLARADMAVDWFPDWSGQLCAVVASGESVTQGDVDLLKGRARVIVINNGYQLAPWADVLYAADRVWWEKYREARAFPGLKVASNKSVAKDYGIKHVTLKDDTADDAHCIHTDHRGIIGHGGHGGFQGLNLAVQFGGSPILLLGFDLCGGHWHEKHQAPLKNPSERTLQKWRVRLDAQAPLLEEMGIEVINCSPVSTLTLFRKMSLVQALSTLMPPTAT